MSALIIILIIVFGLFLFILEFFVFPGITIAGIGGFIFTAGGIFLVYDGYGASYGNWALFGTFISFIVIIAIMLKSKALNRLSLDTELKGKVETVDEKLINEGDEAISITRLNPIGKAMVNNEIVEAKCPGQFIDQDTRLIVKEVHKTFIIVKPLN